MNEEVKISIGISSPLFLTCIICGKTKGRADFLRTKKSGRMKVVTYCSDCALLDDLLQRVDEANTKKNIEEARRKPLVVTSENIEDLDPSAPFITLLSYNPYYTLELPFEKAIKYVREKAARVINETNILAKYGDKKKLRKFIVERDNGSCFFCGDQGDLIYRLIPKAKGGIWSPANTVCICRGCKPLSISEKLKRIDANPNREIGIHSQLGKTCSVCRETRYKNEFVYSSICKACWNTRLNLKEHPTLKLEIREKLSMIDQLNVRNVIRSIEFIFKNRQLVDDVNLLQSNPFIIQVFKEANRWQWKLIHFELAILLVEEGFCRIVPYYPNIIVNIFSQKYRKFRYQILRRDKNICQYCGEPGDTIDHIYPASKGGYTSPRNCVTACQPCNVSKADIIINDLILDREGMEEADKSRVD